MRFLLAILLLLIAAPASAQQGQGMSRALVVSSCGAAALPTSGPLVQLLMNPQGQLCMTGVASLGPPVNTTPPVASGAASEGSTLSCTTGTWTLSPSSYAYTWLRGGSTISGATSATYVLAAADWGTSVGCSVIATNGSGNSAPAASNTIFITCSQATTYLARTTGGNEGGNATNIIGLICGLVTDSVITGTLAGASTCGAPLDVLYILAQQNSADALLNLCGTNYGLTNTGSLTFTTYRGFTGNVTGYMNTNFNPGTAISPHYIQNNADIGIWVVNSRTSGAAWYDIGLNGSSAAGISPFYGAGATQTPLNDAVYPSWGGITNAQGAWSLDRSIAASSIYYKNGVSVTTLTATSGAVISFPFFLFGLNNGGSLLDASGDQLAEAHIGGSLDATKNLALYTRLRTYMSAVGIP